MDTVPDNAAVIAIMRRVAAEEILPRFQALAAGDVWEKKPGDTVTIADIEAEKRLTEALTALLPGSAVVGEEGAAADAGVLAALGGPAPVWVIDPVDGTQNFADGKPCFAVIVALCAGGETTAGWILDPVSDEAVWARPGQGAWMGNRRLGVADPAPVEKMRGSVWRKVRQRLGPTFPGRFQRLGCVGREYMDLALGTLHFARYGGRLKPWDHAAGVLIHAEAGGFAALMEGKVAYRAGPELREGVLLMAPDEAGWDALHAALTK